jgi:hypothetical protein
MIAKPKLLVFYFFALTLTLINMEANAESAPEFSEKHHQQAERKLNLPPKNAFDLIENIKIGIEEDLLIKDSFFTEESMLQFSNGRSIEDLGGKNNFFVIRDIHAEGVNGVDFHRIFGETKRKARLGASFSSPKINIDYLIKVFGLFQEIKDPYASSDSRHPVLLEKTTHRYGNMATHHVLRGNLSKTDIYAITSGDGSIIQLNFDQTEE